MRKLFNHSTYWALTIGVTLAMVEAIALGSRWLFDTLGGKLTMVGFWSAVAAAFVYNVARTYRSAEADEHIRGKLGALGRICGMLLCWRTVLMAVLAFFAWFAWRDIGSYHEAHSWAVPDALLVLGFLVCLAALAFLAGRESRNRAVSDLRGLIAKAQAEYGALAAHHGSMVAQLGGASESTACGRQDANAELSSADLLAASQQFAAQA
ncbi:hypothetical protein LA345_38745 (plasmid) [Burkholderia vietnamiensis]|uniref:Uncharacterized protein n=1 Tax=Burkholderia vietnamiensis (strain G4 / LMG 22486) TaxID=269482 RepID=A4JWB2_BURVG|nr:hypothetical protein Bcep1808_7695 [Burkholderia vietnamiensis G4]MCB4349737.1 hypothetical protein [Burkholderia vietnamiensis]